MLKFVVLVISAALAADAGFLTDQHSIEVSSPSITSQSSSIVRGPENLSEFSAYEKTVDTQSPYSAQEKLNERIRNPNFHSHRDAIVYSPAPSRTFTGYTRTYGPSTFPPASTVSHVTYNTGPVAYANVPLNLGHETANYVPSYADHAVGSSRESTVQSLDGNQAVTHYSKAVDAAFSSVRKPDTRANNDAKLLSTSPTLTYASAAYATPIVMKSAIVGQVNPAISYSSAPVVAHATFAGLGTRYSW